jgi:hypothetical protein
MAIFAIHRHGRSQFQALSGILRVAACLTRDRRHAAREMPAATEGGEKYEMGVSG